MKETKKNWRCEKCKGENVSQEWSIFIPMNNAEKIRENPLYQDGAWAQTLDSFWCEDCNKECNPEKDLVEETP